MAKNWYKSWWAIAIYVITFIVFITSFDSNDSTIKPSNQNISTDTVNTTQIEIKKIVGKPITEVEKIIGTADSITVENPSNTECNVTTCELAIFQSGKYEILFINNKADWITINQVSNYDFDKKSLKYIGLPEVSPTFENPNMVMRWNNIENIYEINFFNNSQNKIDYIYIKNLTK